MTCNLRARAWRKGLRLTLKAALPLVFVAPLADAAERVFYRYTNEQGVMVLDSHIPPAFAQRGYQVVTATGHVVKDVPPAPDSADVDKVNQARLEAERLAEWDERLLRRYSTVADIEAAKARKLAELQGDLAILTGNLRNIKSQIAAMQSTAADQERQGREVPASVLSNLSILEAELAQTEEQIRQRQAEYDAVANRFDQDAKRFGILRPEPGRP